MPALAEFAILLALRLLIAFCINRNYDYPDEYWQGPEIAHLLGFGWGYQTWEWTQSQPLRSPFYPWLLSLGYRVLPHSWILAGPKLIHSIIVAIADYYLLKIVRRGASDTPLGSFLWLIAGSYGYFSVMSRTYLNSFETALTVIGYYYWLQGHRALCRLWAGLAYLARPTSLMIWAVVWIHHLFVSVRQWRAGKQTLRAIALYIGANVLWMYDSVDLAWEWAPLQSASPHSTTAL